MICGALRYVGSRRVGAALSGLKIGSCQVSAFDPFLPSTRRTAVRRNPAGSRFLNGRARDIGVGAENAAIALERLQHCSAMLAVVEILASIGRHRLGRYAAALRAGQS